MIFVKSTIKNARLSTIAIETWLQNQIHKLTFIRWNGFILSPKGLHSKWFVYTTLDVICYVITQADKMYYFTLTPFTTQFIIFWLSIFISKYYSLNSKWAYICEARQIILISIKYKLEIILYTNMFCANGMCYCIDLY